MPFFDEDAGAENSFVIASPGGFAGAASVSLTSRLQGAELQGVVQAFDAKTCTSRFWSAAASSS